MTLNMLFFTITIKFKKMTAEDYLHQQQIKKLRDEYIDRAIQYRSYM
ncbi:YrzI family small protein [Peribacillus saganii]|uniref:YrzI family small protein n=1 Tax=Peribacillus saganii TaxID=2303992 RepID=A0A372LUZ9_9BACI|nr:YrzI family small protein [Peribacillus saganii]RFU71642.1 YrzI family small protein [Peribacillus saganii]